MTAYQIAWQKKRIRRSFLAAFLLHFLLIGGALLYNLFFVEDLEDFSGPVLIKLGEPEGADLPLPPEPADTPEPPEETVPETADLPEEAEVIREAYVPEETPSSLPDTAEKPEVETPSQSDTPRTETAAAPESVPEKPAEPEPVTIMGSEDGNAHETVFSTEEGVIGRNVYLQINWFMPLPYNLDQKYFDNIEGDAINSSEDFKRIITRYYSDNPVGKGFYLNQDAADNMTYEERYTCWSILEKSGYPLSEAEYKKNRTLKPVVLSFTIEANAVYPQEVEVLKSCGYSDIDEAVKYGFGVSQYSNSTDRKVKGRFTYRFD